MSELIKINRHPCFVGLTRPPMKWGVTITFLMLNALIHLFLFIVSRRLGVPFWFLLMSAGSIHLVGMITCRYDVNYFDLWLGHAKYSTMNKDIWGCNSYEAY